MLSQNDFPSKYFAGFSSSPERSNECQIFEMPAMCLSTPNVHFNVNISVDSNQIGCLLHSNNAWHITDSPLYVIGAPTTR